jgi:L-arabinokinase
LAQAIVFYISGHGFGHASRSIEVINAILAQRPETRVGVRTSAPRWLFDMTVKGKVTYSTLECDTGVVQVDALTLDEADSIRRASSFHSDLVTRAASETRALRELGAGIIVGDIPPLAFAVGASAGNPVDRPRQLHVGLGLRRLPARAACAVAATGDPRRVCEGVDGAAPADVGRVRELLERPRHSVRRTARVTQPRGSLQDPQAAGRQAVRAVLVWWPGLSGIDTDVLAKFKKYTVITAVTAPLGRAQKNAPASERKGSYITINEEAMYNVGVRYEDLVGAAEAVVTKPGYGIVSECIANDAAILYTPRGHFPEYDVIVEEMPKYLRSALITHDDLFAGKWESQIDKLLAQPKIKKKPETNGAAVAADILLKALDKPPKKPRGRPRAKV